MGVPCFKVRWGCKAEDPRAVGTSHPVGEKGDPREWGFTHPCN